MNKLNSQTRLEDKKEPNTNKCCCSAGRYFSDDVLSTSQPECHTVYYAADFTARAGPRCDSKGKKRARDRKHIQDPCLSIKTSVWYVSGHTNHTPRKSEMQHL